jgi:hypothetical protein
VKFDLFVVSVGFAAFALFALAAIVLGAGVTWLFGGS